MIEEASTTFSVSCLRVFSQDVLVPQISLGHNIGPSVPWVNELLTVSMLPRSCPILSSIGVPLCLDLILHLRPPFIDGVSSVDSVGVRANNSSGVWGR